MKACGCALVVGFAPACLNSEDPTPSCEPRAAFRITIDARTPSLPADTTVEVQHGGGCERYRLQEREVSPCTNADQVGVLFCEPSPKPSAGGAGAGAANAETGELRCELWTEGAASLTVEGGDFAPVEQELEAEADECGLRTVDVALTLGSADAGI